GGLTGARVKQRVQRLRITGKTIARLLDTVQVYRGRKWILAQAFGISLVMALCYVASYYFVARGLAIDGPSWSEHLVIVPVAGLVGSVPVTVSGLGTTEYAIDKLYQAMPGHAAIVAGDGML